MDQIARIFMFCLYGTGMLIVIPLVISFMIAMAGFIITVVLPIMIVVVGSYFIYKKFTEEES